MATRARSVSRISLAPLLVGMLAAILAAPAVVPIASAAAAPAEAPDRGDALREAARAGDLAAVRAALAAGTPVDEQGRNGVTALHLAAGKGHLPVVETLLAAGAAVNRRESFFSTAPLDAALGGDHRAVALALLAAGVDDPTAALAVAAEKGDVELARAALAGDRVEPLDLAAVRRSLTSALASPAEPAASDSGGNQPDDGATRTGREAIAALLATATPTRRERPVFTPDADRLRAATGRFRGRDAALGDLELNTELRGNRLLVSVSGPGAAAIAAAGSLPVAEIPIPPVAAADPATSAGGAPPAAAGAAADATAKAADPLVLELLPISRDRFESVSGDTRFEVAGRAGLIEWAALNRNGHEFSFSAVTAPPAPELAAASGSDLGPAIRTAARPWPQFRGIAAAGNGDGQGAPARWDVAGGGNVRFKTAIPGLALSSPIVWDGRIYLTTAVSTKGDATFRTGLYGDGTSVDDLSEHTFALYALDATTGEVLWQRDVVRTAPTVRRHLKSSLANPTPATDGERIVVLFSTVGVLATFDPDGRELWRREIGALDCNDPQAGVAEWGCASSPVIHDGLVYVQADHRRDSFLAAWRLSDGTEVWRVSRPEPSTWSTPALLPAPGNDPPFELVTNGTTIRGYHPATGAELWRLGPNSEVVVATPVIGPAPAVAGATATPATSLAYVTAGYPPIRPVYAIRAGQRGDLTLAAGETASAAIAWSHPRGGTYLPTPLLYRDHLYTLNNNGLLTVYRTADGSEVHRARVGPSGTSFSASPVAADGRLFLASEGGEVYILAAAPDFGLLAVNPMQEVVMATPAIADGLLVIRTLGHVVGIAETPGTAVAEVQTSR